MLYNFNNGASIEIIQSKRAKDADYSKSHNLVVEFEKSQLYWKDLRKSNAADYYYFITAGKARDAFNYLLAAVKAGKKIAFVSDKYWTDGNSGVSFKEMEAIAQWLQVILKARENFSVTCILG